MVHVIEFYWIYLALACVLGCLVGVLIWNNRPRGSWLGGWFGWALALFAIGVIVALLRVVPGRYGLYLELALLFFAAYVVGCLVGGVFRTLFAPVYHGGGADQVLPETASGAAPDAPAPATAAPLVSQPPSDNKIVQPGAPVAPAEMGSIAAPIGGKPDDLKRIRGIGPTLEKKLNGTGIFHFSQIAAWTEADVEAAGELLSFQGRIEREDWIGQAKLLASGGETEFSRRVDDGDVPSSRNSDG